MSNTHITPDMTITYGDTSLNFATLPHASLMAMLSRGVTHYLGSEQASKVNARFAPKKPSKNWKAPDDVSPEAQAAFKSECIATAIAALTAGTVGVSTRGPFLDPLDARVAKIAKEEIIPTLTKAKLAWPKNSKSESGEIIPGTVPLGGIAYTGAKLIARRLDGFIGANGPVQGHRDRITKLAKEQLAEERQRAATAKKAESVDEL